MVTASQWVQSVAMHVSRGAVASDGTTPQFEFFRKAARSPEGRWSKTSVAVKFMKDFSAFSNRHNPDADPKRGGGTTHFSMRVARSPRVTQSL